MKKTAFTLKRIISFYLRLLLVPLFFQSCDEEKELQVSADGNRQSYMGPSYLHISNTALGPGENIGMLISFSFLSGLGKYYEKGSGAFNNTSFSNSEDLYASSSHGSSVFYNSSETDGEVTSISIKTKHLPVL